MAAVVAGGTGTGYHAALLAHRLGAEYISTIEIDPDLANHARKALSNAGFGAVTVVTGDGELGYPPGAPYDRVICTAECARIPYSWIAQTRPGGRILTPWANSYFNGGLLALTVGSEGTATGSIVDRASFMRLRHQREPPREPVGDIVGDDEDHRSAPLPVHRRLRRPTRDQPAGPWFGARQLWDEVEAAYRWWDAAGRPHADQWRFTITPDGQRVEPPR